MIVYLGLGSNQGDRIGYVQQAVQSLTLDPDIRLLSASSFYETEPVGKVDQPWFVNAVIVVDTALSPDALLSKCQAVEDQLGRVRDPEQPKGPRTIDIDLLVYDDWVVDEPHLTVPHPAVAQRACVLVPLLEVNAKLLHPVLGQTVAQLHQALEAPEDVVLYGTLPQESS